MATVLFYEKPGCINNTRQKKILEEAGHKVEAKNLLTHCWKKEELKNYFVGLPVNEWFNQSAPSVKSGVVEPDHVTDDEALSLMLSDPLLIRRPLMKVTDGYMAGFDILSVDRWIGLGLKRLIENIEDCPREL